MSLSSIARPFLPRSISLGIDHETILVMIDVADIDHEAILVTIDVAGIDCETIPVTIDVARIECGM